MERRRGYRALVVEEDASVVDQVRGILETEGFSVEAVTEGFAAINLMKTVQYDLLILDLVIPESGDALLDYLEAEQPSSLRRVVMTTPSRRELPCDFLERISHQLEKPFDVGRLELLARECAENAA